MLSEGRNCFYRSLIALFITTGMEDAHATVLNLDEKTGDEKASFFAVYDGHGGGCLECALGHGLRDSSLTELCLPKQARLLLNSQARRFILV